MFDNKIYLYTMPMCDKCDIVKSWLKENELKYEEFDFDTYVQLAFIMNNNFGSPPIIVKNDLEYSSESMFVNDSLNIDIMKKLFDDCVVKRVNNKYLGYVKCPICMEKGELGCTRYNNHSPTFYAYVNHRKTVKGERLNLYKCFLGKIINGSHVILPNGSKYRIDNRKTGRKTGRRKKSEIK